MFVVECFVPDVTSYYRGQRVQALAVSEESATMMVSPHDAARQRVTTQVVRLDEQGIHLHPLTLRYRRPSELDLMATQVGLQLRERHVNWDRQPFDSASGKHVSGRCPFCPRCSVKEVELKTVSLTIGVDIGGTKVLGGIVDPSGKVLETSRRPTPADDGAAARNMIIEVVQELAAKHEVEAVGIGATGWIDAARSTVLFATNLAWRDEPLQRHVQAAVDLPVVVENDANAAAWAEFRYGAARDANDSTVMFTVGTGIGGGIVLNGRLLRGACGIAAEPGHMLAVPGGRLCGCGRLGCLDQYASGSALVRFAREGAAANPSSMSGVAELTGAMVTEAAHAGDAIAVEAFSKIAYWLAQGVADIVNLLDPQVVVIGGGVVETGDLLMARLLTAYREALASRGKFPGAEVRPAEMGNEAGLVGAADLARLR